MQTYNIKGEDHYQSRDVKAERDRLRGVAKGLSEAIKTEMEHPNTGTGKAVMREALEAYEEYEQIYQTSKS